MTGKIANENNGRYEHSFLRFAVSEVASRILPVSNDGKLGKSPLEDIPYITADITTQEIVDLIRESRAGI